MELTLYLPYYEYNDKSFDVSGDYYKSDEYINKIKEEDTKNKDLVYKSILNLKEGSQSVFMGRDGQTYKFAEKASQNEEKVAYSSCNGIVYSDDGNDLNVDGLITNFVGQKPFVCLLELDMDSFEEEFESELYLWLKEHKNIQRYNEKFDEEWVWKNEPKRNIKIRFLNNANETIYGMLENCKIMDIIESNMFIIYVERLNLIDN
jgi:hypothetical protein